MNEELGEFWLRNPWQQDDHNLSSFERNRLLLNAGSGRFLDISHLTSADVDSDSRGVVAGDFTGNGMPDLIVRSVGGGPLKVFQNRWPQKRWLRVSLRGTKSNSLGLGAKLKFEVAGRTLWRELYPHCSYQSQLASEVHVGLGDAVRIDALTIYWPSGTVQELKHIPADQHIEITEGIDRWQPFGTRRGRTGNDQ